jgi:hypothetical protein
LLFWFVFDVDSFFFRFLKQFESYRVGDGHFFVIDDVGVMKFHPWHSWSVIMNEVLDRAYGRTDVVLRFTRKEEVSGECCRELVEKWDVVFEDDG